MVNIIWLFLEMCDATAYIFHIVSCAEHELPSSCSEQACSTLVDNIGDYCALHSELELIRSKEKYKVTNDMPPDRRRKIVESLRKAVMRCKNKHLQPDSYQQTLAKDRGARQIARDSRTPEEKKADDQAGSERMKRARDALTPEEKKAEVQAESERKQRTKDARTSEEKTAEEQAANERMQRARCEWRCEWD
jgi:hypothetical protein